MSEEAQMPTVVLDIGKSDPGDPHRTRTTNFIAVEWSWRTMAYTVRLPLQLDGVNDMEGRQFDFWFERLKKAAASGNTRVKVAWDYAATSPGIGLSGAQRQKSYTGILCTTGNMKPRLCPGNSSLFEFDLCEVTTAEVISAWDKKSN